MFDSGDDQLSLYCSLLLINSVRSAKCFWITLKITKKVSFWWYCVIVNHIKLTLHWKLSFNCLTKHFISPTFVYGSFISLNFLKLSPLMKSVSFNRLPLQSRLTYRFSQISACNLSTWFLTPKDQTYRMEIEQTGALKGQDCPSLNALACLLCHYIDFLALSL
mgnify:CR=1 FL=1